MTIETPPCDVKQNRSARRRLLAFGKKAGTLVTSLVVRGELLGSRPHAAVIAGAIEDWLTGRARTCFVCRNRLAPCGFAAFLCAVAARAPATAAISGVCQACWRDRDIVEIEAGAVRVLRTAMPDGRFLDDGPVPLPTEAPLSPDLDQGTQ